MDLDEIAYGNLIAEQGGALQKDSYLDTYFSEFTELSFPPNTSPTTKQELNEIVECLDAASMNIQALHKFMRYDADMHNIFVKFLVSNGVERNTAGSLINAITMDVVPLITKLKYYYQRPRPGQLAYYYKLQLFPQKSYSADSPAYPSSHAVQSRLFANIIGNKYPPLAKEAVALASDMAISRLYMGVNYSTSLDYGIMIADRVISNKELCLKYQI